MDKIKVIIVDDNVSFVKEMVKIINHETDMVVVGTAFSKDEAISLVKNIETDVVIMDINLSENKCDGITATLEINKIKPTKVIMLTSLENDDEIIINSFTAGARNYILKEELLKIPATIRCVNSHQSPMDILLKDYGRMKEEAVLNELTQTEKVVYRMVEEGSSRAKMQDRLVKSENTIKNQLKKIYKKLKVRSSKEAIEKVKSKGTIEPQI